MARLRRRRALNTRRCAGRTPARTIGEERQRVGGIERAPVGAHAGQGVVRLADADDPRAERDAVAADPERVAVAAPIPVPNRVIMEGDRRDLAHLRRLPEEFGTIDGVVPELPLRVAGQRRLVAEDRQQARATRRNCRGARGATAYMATLRTRLRCNARPEASMIGRRTASERAAIPAGADAGRLAPPPSCSRSPACIGPPRALFRIRCRATRSQPAVAPTTTRTTCRSALEGDGCPAASACRRVFVSGEPGDHNQCPQPRAASCVVLLPSRPPRYGWDGITDQGTSETRRRVGTPGGLCACVKG